MNNEEQHEENSPKGKRARTESHSEPKTIILCKEIKRGTKHDKSLPYPQGNSPARKCIQRNCQTSPLDTPSYNGCQEELEWTTPITTPFIFD